MTQRFYICILAAGLTAGAFWGCSGTKSTANRTPDQAPAQASPKPGNREQSLEHYLQGSMLDQKGEYAKAILEYQDALRYQKDPAIFYAVAKDYSIIGKNELAVENAKEAIRLDPGNRTYHETLADIYVNARDLDGAIGEYAAITRIDSTYKQAWMNLAHLQQVRDPGQALKTYGTILDRFGPEDDIYYQLAQLYAAKHDFSKAAGSLRDLLRLDPGNDDVKKALGDLYLQQDSVDSALGLYNQLVADHPQNVELRAAIAHALLVKQDYDKASEQFDIVLRKDTLSADDQLRFGRVFVAFIQKDSAVAPYAKRLFQRIRDSYPDDWRPYWFLGAIENITHNDTAALFDYNRVRTLAKWNPDGWVGVASVYYDRGVFDSTISILQNAETVAQEEFRVHFLLGIAYQRVHRNPDAVTELEKALHMDDKNVDALTALALTLDEMKRIDESDSIYERALRIDPHNHLLLNNYGYSLAERGLQLDRALKMSKEAVDLQPANQSYLDTYGWIFYMRGDYHEAEKWIKKAVDIGGANAVLNEHLGDIYSKLSEKEKALDYWHKALELDSTNQSLKDKIQRGGL
jgi:tetratricopeptide (TPR) repeat protein